MKPEGESVLSDDNPEEEIVRLKESLKKIREFLEFITVKK